MKFHDEGDSDRRSRRVPPNRGGISYDRGAGRSQPPGRLSRTDQAADRGDGSLHRGGRLPARRGGRGGSADAVPRTRRRRARRRRGRGFQSADRAPARCADAPDGRPPAPRGPHLARGGRRLRRGAHRRGAGLPAGDSSCRCAGRRCGHGRHLRARLYSAQDRHGLEHGGGRGAGRIAAGDRLVRGTRLGQCGDRCAPLCGALPVATAALHGHRLDVPRRLRRRGPAHGSGRRPARAVAPPL